MKKSNNQNKQIVKFKATKFVKKPTVVSFKTKDGKRVSFPATKVVKQSTNISFKAKKGGKN